MGNAKVAIQYAIHVGDQKGDLGTCSPQNPWFIVPFWRLSVDSKMVDGWWLGGACALKPPPHCGGQLFSLLHTFHFGCLCGQLLTITAITGDNSFTSYNKGTEVQDTHPSHTWFIPRKPTRSIWTSGFVCRLSLSQERFSPWEI